MGKVWGYNFTERWSILEGFCLIFEDSARRYTWVLILWVKALFISRIETAKILCGSTTWCSVYNLPMLKYRQVVNWTLSCPQRICIVSIEHLVKLSASFKPSIKLSTENLHYFYTATGSLQLRMMSLYTDCIPISLVLLARLSHPCFPREEGESGNCGQSLWWLHQLVRHT